jgi:hypothetical protein
MRTTLDIEEDVLEAARELAVREKSTAGRVLSRLARAGLQAPGAEHGKQAVKKNGIPVFPRRGDEIVTLDHVRKLMDEEGV